MSQPISFFAQTMAIQEEALQYHQETDEYLRNQRRQILLQLLKSIKEDPPEFLKENQYHSIEELDQYILNLEKITKP